MNWLIHNPIGDMPGPAFLLVYLVVAMATCIVAHRLLRASDPTDTIELPPVPIEPDPYRIAYLRGGENEVIRIVLFALTERGYVSVVQDALYRFLPKVNKLAQTSNQFDLSELTELERVMFDAVEARVVPTSLFGRPDLTARVAEECSPYKKELEAEARRDQACRVVDLWRRCDGAYGTGRIQAARVDAQGTGERLLPDLHVLPHAGIAGRGAQRGDETSPEPARPRLPRTAQTRIRRP
jgi:hypothetical protein